MFLEHNWDVLNNAKRRLLTFSDNFIWNYVQEHGLTQSTFLEVAAGGLFCVRYSCYNPYVKTRFVYNPILKTVKQLPHLTGWEDTQKVVMSTDRVSMEYEIIVFFLPDEYAFSLDNLNQPYSIFVYESKTSKWRQAPYNPKHPSVNYPTYRVRLGSLTIFRNQLYCIVDKGSSQGIVSYDKETREVSDLGGVNIPWAPTSHLVVCKDKLFCVIHVKNDTDDFPSVEIFEINIAKKESILLTQIPPYLLLWVLGQDLEPRFSRNPYENEIKVATRGADSMIFLTWPVVGRCAAYSFSKNYWYKYPSDHDLQHASIWQSDMPEYLVGSYCLSLCPP